MTNMEVDYDNGSTAVITPTLEDGSDTKTKVFADAAPGIITVSDNGVVAIGAVPKAAPTTILNFHGLLKSGLTIASVLRGIEKKLVEGVQLLDASHPANAIMTEVLGQIRAVVGAPEDLIPTAGEYGHGIIDGVVAQSVGNDVSDTLVTGVSTVVGAKKSSSVAKAAPAAAAPRVKKTTTTTTVVASDPIPEGDAGRCNGLLSNKSQCEKHGVSMHNGLPYCVRHYNLKMKEIAETSAAPVTTVSEDGTVVAAPAKATTAKRTKKTVIADETATTTTAEEDGAVAAPEKKKRKTNAKTTTTTTTTTTGEAVTVGDVPDVVPEDGEVAAAVTKRTNKKSKAPTPSEEGSAPAVAEEQQQQTATEKKMKEVKEKVKEVKFKCTKCLVNGEQLLFEKNYHVVMDNAYSCYGRVPEEHVNAVLEAKAAGTPLEVSQLLVQDDGVRTLCGEIGLNPTF